MARRSRYKRRLISFLAALICVVVTALVYGGGEASDFLKSFGSPTASDLDKNSDFVRFIDVGQGDCALIYSNGRTALIDTGTVSSANDVCEELYSLGIRSIDVMLISHLHSDHIGGAERILESFEVKNLILPELSTFSEGMSLAQNAINAVTSSSGGVYSAVSGMNFNVGEFEITVLAAYEDDNENNRSIFAMARIGDKKFLFAGDAETKMEKLLLKEGLNLDCDVFKASHHGSNTSNSIELLDAIKPKYAAISVGDYNSYGHPHKEILAELERRKVSVLRTDKSGDITFWVSEGQITAQTQK